METTTTPGEVVYIAYQDVLTRNKKPPDYRTWPELSELEQEAWNEAGLIAVDWAYLKMQGRLRIVTALEKFNMSESCRFVA